MEPLSPKAFTLAYDLLGTDDPFLKVFHEPVRIKYCEQGLPMDSFIRLLRDYKQPKSLKLVIQPSVCLKRLPGCSDRVIEQLNEQRLEERLGNTLLSRSTLLLDSALLKNVLYETVTDHQLRQGLNVVINRKVIRDTRFHKINQISRETTFPSTSTPRYGLVETRKMKENAAKENRIRHLASLEQGDLDSQQYSLWKDAENCPVCCNKYLTKRGYSDEYGASKFCPCFTKSKEKT